MKKIKSSTIIKGLIIWFAIFLTDIICSFTISHPIFTLPVTGGEVTTFWGLGYMINHYYAMTPTGYRDGGFEVIPTFYIIINIIIIAFLIFRDNKE